VPQGAIFGYDAMTHVGIEAPLEELAREAEKALATLSPDSGLGQDGARFLRRIRDESGLRMPAVHVPARTDARA
jgi:hypothetical protein